MPPLMSEAAPRSAVPGGLVVAAVVALLVALHVGFLWHAAAAVAWTADEPNYLGAGHALWTDFGFTTRVERLHGPLPFLANHLFVDATQPIDLAAARLPARLGMLPFALLLLDTKDAWLLLSLVWGGATLGLLFRVFWVGAPRWLYVPIYIALGWAAVFWLPEFKENGSTAVIVLLAVGGLLYTIGAVVYGFKRPDPWPNWYGFHEIFHTLTIAAFIVHYIGVSLLAYQTY